MRKVVVRFYSDMIDENNWKVHCVPKINELLRQQVKGRNEVHVPKRDSKKFSGTSVIY